MKKSGFFITLYQEKSGNYLPKIDTFIPFFSEDTLFLSELEGEKTDDVPVIWFWNELSFLFLKCFFIVFCP
ncbi:MAG: hypothetical protein DRH04_03040 [Deltaproteobacteria bacterium]|nr:MAG: hypothetical protein DRH04_03040 [Deltaproteobacteria bacterium]